VKKPVLISACILCVLSIAVFVFFMAFSAAPAPDPQFVSPPADSVQKSGDFTISRTSDGKGIRITEYTGKGGDVRIPAEFEGLPVREIDEGSFSENTTITGVTVPEGVEFIGIGAFRKCSNLAAITLPTSIKIIHAMSFSGCSALVSVYIPDSVTEINFAAFHDSDPAGDNYAFSTCDMLPSETQKRLRKLGYTGWLPSIDATPKLTTYREHDFEYIISKVGGAVITKYLGKGTDVVIPDTLMGKSVIAIGHDAFRDRSDIVRVTLPASVELIHEESFKNCSNLVSITLPASIKTIGVMSFSGCSKLAHVRIPDSVRSISFPRLPPQANISYAFYGCPLSPESQNALEARGWEKDL
jgi:hypothetical protein